MMCAIRMLLVKIACSTLLYKHSQQRLDCMYHLEMKQDRKLISCQQIRLRRTRMWVLG